MSKNTRTSGHKVLPPEYRLSSAEQKKIQSYFQNIAGYKLQFQQVLQKHPELEPRLATLSEYSQFTQYLFEHFDINKRYDIGLLAKQLKLVKEMMAKIQQYSFQMQKKVKIDEGGRVQRLDGSSLQFDHIPVIEVLQASTMAERQRFQQMYASVRNVPRQELARLSQEMLRSRV